MSSQRSSSNGIENPAVTRFREYLRINTTSVANLDDDGPQPDYGEVLLSRVQCHIDYCASSTVANAI